MGWETCSKEEYGFYQLGVGDEEINWVLVSVIIRSAASMPD